MASAPSISVDLMTKNGELTPREGKITPPNRGKMNLLGTTSGLHGWYEMDQNPGAAPTTVGFDPI
jgi:hypothetical protein